ETGERILALVNVSDQRISLKVDASGTDVIGNRHVDGTVDLAPYQIMWIRMEERGGPGAAGSGTERTGEEGYVRAGEGEMLDGKGSFHFRSCRHRHQNI